ncbi:MAG: hypothetical protein M1480_07880 [Bacteroidetes bacterium]|nr:hypothetical protein [Bacteroidota bacterium]
MKKIFFLIFIIVTNSFPHKQHVHRYLAIEGYNLLKNYIGTDIPHMNQHVDISGDILPPWTSGMIASGAYREDEEDVVYGYSKMNPPENECSGIYDLIAYFREFTLDPLVSNIHLGDADNCEGSNLENLLLIYNPIFLSSCNVDSVSNKTIERPDTNIRANYIYMTLGIIEPIALGFGFQINSDWSLGIKLCGYFLYYGTYTLNSGLGIGIRISKKIKWGFINNINSELTMLNRISDSRSSEIFIKGASLDINIGNENISSKGLHFIWSVGVVGSFANRIPPLFSPNLKIGFNINI